MEIECDCKDRRPIPNFRYYAETVLGFEPHTLRELHDWAYVMLWEDYFIYAYFAYRGKNSPQSSRRILPDQSRIYDRKGKASV